jgi:hypothetical protein
MKSIKFSDKELDFLREQYSEELANAEKYVEQIRDILRKLDVPTKTEKINLLETETKKDRKKDKKHKGKDSLLKEPKKRGRKPKIDIDIIKSTPAIFPAKSEGLKSKESKELKKRGRPKLITITENTPEILTNAVVKIERKKTEPKPIKVEKKQIIKRGLKPNLVTKADIVTAIVPAPELKTTVEPKLKRIVKVVAEKKAAIKSVKKNTSEPIIINELPSSPLATPNPNSPAKAVAKKKPVQKQKLSVKGATKKQSKPVINKEVIVKSKVEIPIIEQLIGSAEEPKV